VRRGTGGPFGAVVVREDALVGRGWNTVVGACDPTAHAEVTAIRDACTRLQRFHLDDCALYATCEPCPMCLGAVYWARIPAVIYAQTREDAARIGFADEHIFHELARPPGRRAVGMRQVTEPTAAAVFAEWESKADKTRY